MSLTHSTVTPFSTFQPIIVDALRIYQECKKHHPIEHPLATKLQTCTSPSSVLDIVQEQIRELDLSRSRREGWRKWVAPTLNIFFAIAATVGIVGLLFIVLIAQVFSWQSALFAGSGVLFSAAQAARASQDVFSDTFERVEMFLQRLEMYTEAQLTTEMTDILVQIMVEVLVILEIATNEINQSRMRRIIMKLPLINSNWTDIAEILNRLDKLTQEEGRMAVAHNLKVTHCHNVAHGYIKDEAV